MILSDEANNLLSKIKAALKGKANLESALNILLKEICSYTGWNYGEAWLPVKSQKQLKFITSWSSNKNIFEDFEKFSSHCKFAKGIGLVGKTWEAKKNLWDKELSISSDFLRYDLGKQAGISYGISFFYNLQNDTPLVLSFFTINENSNDKKYFETISEIQNEVENILAAHN